MRTNTVEQRFIYHSFEKKYPAFARYFRENLVNIVHHPAEKSNA
jgi:hypothetical protein